MVGLSNEKVTETFGNTIAQLRADLARAQGSDFRFVGHWTETDWRGNSTLPPRCVMIGPWIDTPWNGSATTS